MILLETSHSALFDAVVQWFGPWQTYYSHSKVAETGIMFVHLVALLFGGGYAVAADRAVLRVTSQRTLASPADQTSARFAMTLDTLHTIHRPVLIGLAFVIVSGLAMAVADLETFATSWVFWTKMACFALLSVNGLLLMNTETALRERVAAGTPPAPDATSTDQLWRRLRKTAFASITLWTLTLFVGTILANNS